MFAFSRVYLDLKLKGSLGQWDCPARSVKYKGISEISDHSKHTILLLHLLRYYYTWAKPKWQKRFWI